MLIAGLTLGLGMFAVFGAILYARGHWTLGLGVANAVLGAAFAVPALWLLQTGMLFNPALVDALAATTDGQWATITGAIIALSIAVIVAWDAIDGFRKAMAWRNTTGRSSVRGT